MRSTRRRVLVAIPIAVGLVLALSGCSELQIHGFLPGFEAGQSPVTNHTDMISQLWVGSWITLLTVGLVAWGLILWAAVVYRRRRGQTGLPVQLRYNMPIEIFYTVTPLILVLGLFAFTAKDQDAIESRTVNPDVVVNVYGKQWAWDFQYEKENVYSFGVQAAPATGADANAVFTEASIPQMVLPVGKTVELKLQTRDVNHSFWVIDFLYKKDLIAGQTNYEYFTPLRTGTYQGRCAELCGEYHSRMLFTVKVVQPAEYESYIAKLRADGDVGKINDLDKGGANQHVANAQVNGLNSNG